MYNYGIGKENVHEFFHISFLSIEELLSKIFL